MPRRTRSRRRTVSWRSSITRICIPATRRPRRSSRSSTRRMRFLSDKEKKARYDQFGHAGVDPNFGGGAGGSPFTGDIDFGDIFNSFFGGFGGGGARRKPERPAPRQRRRGRGEHLLRGGREGLQEKPSRTIAWRPARTAAAPARRRAPAPRRARSATAPVRCASASGPRSAWCRRHAAAIAAAAPAR